MSEQQKYTADDIARLREQMAASQGKRLEQLKDKSELATAEGVHARFVSVLSQFEKAMIDESERNTETVEVVMGAGQMLGGLLASLVIQSARPGSEQFMLDKMTNLAHRTAMETIGHHLIEKIAQMTGVPVPDGADALAKGLAILGNPVVQAREQQAKNRLSELFGAFGANVKMVTIGPDGVTGDVDAMPDELKQMLGLDRMQQKRTLN